MNHHDDEQWEKRMRQALKEGVKQIEFSEIMQEAVLQKLHARNSTAKNKRVTRISRRMRVAWAAGLTGAVACVVLFLVIFQFGVNSSLQIGQHGFGFVSSASQGSTINAISTSAQLTASLAPIESTLVRLVPHITHSMEQRANTLSSSPFTVKMQLYNNSKQPVNGQDLQGMLFILNEPVGLNPVTQEDWEYFINGPSQVIPPHKSVSWSFTPNPVPPFQTLINRYAHVIWLYRKTQANQPTLQLGTLPVRVSQVQLQVLSTRHDGMQYLQITAMLHNASNAPWSMRSALGMLFFQNIPGDLLLSLGTYKYFDDITPAAGQPAVIPPGKDSKAVFLLGGIPGVDMTKLPLSIFLVDRTEIGA